METDKLIYQVCKDVLLDQLEESIILRENLTISKYEQFQEWIDSLDYDTITTIVFKEQDEQAKLSKRKSVV